MDLDIWATEDASAVIRFDKEQGNHVEVADCPRSRRSAVALLRCGHRAKEDRSPHADLRVLAEPTGSGSSRGRAGTER